jgi:hypothetical protein
MATLTIKYYRDSFNSQRTYAIKKSKHGHYFINQYNYATKLYSAFKRVSVKTIKALINSSTPCNKPASSEFTAKVSAILADHNMESNVNISTLYSNIINNAYWLKRNKGAHYAEDYLQDHLQQGYDRGVLQDGVDLICEDVLVGAA